VISLPACGQSATIVSLVKRAGGRRGSENEAVVMTGDAASYSDMHGSGDAQGPGGPGTTWWAWEMTLLAAADAPGLARQATREVLIAWHVSHLEETAVLFVSELVTNAVQHAGSTGSKLVLRLEAGGTRLRIEVQDDGPQWPQPGIPSGLGESGFGLIIVDALASTWGVSETPTGKAVWAELDTRPGHQPG
jgi:anti-sigma regulatory factor (Ser/Thr protein kinase)